MFLVYCDITLFFKLETFFVQTEELAMDELRHHYLTRSDRRLAKSAITVQRVSRDRIREIMKHTKLIN